MVTLLPPFLCSFSPSFQYLILPISPTAFSQISTLSCFLPLASGPLFSYSLLFLTFLSAFPLSFLRLFLFNIDIFFPLLTPLSFLLIHFFYSFHLLIFSPSFWSIFVFYSFFICLSFHPLSLLFFSNPIWSCFNMFLFSFSPFIASLSALALLFFSFVIFFTYDVKLSPTFPCSFVLSLMIFGVS